MEVAAGLEARGRASEARDRQAAVQVSGNATRLANQIHNVARTIEAGSPVMREGELLSDDVTIGLAMLRSAGGSNSSFGATDALTLLRSARRGQRRGGQSVRAKAAKEGSAKAEAKRGDGEWEE